MSKQETKQEVVEFEILTPEQIKALPDDVHENVTFLTDNARPKELMKLNPIVVRLLNMRENVDKLELKKDEDGNFKKESIEEYKAWKAEQRSFNGDLERTSKKLQKPYQDINKGFISIRKTFKDESDKLKEEAEKKFAPYEEEKIRKKKEADEKRDKELKDEIAKRDEQTKELQNKQKVSSVYNDIKFVEIAENISDNASDAIIEKNEDALQQLKAQIAQKTFEKITAKYETEVLDDTMKTELEAAFDKAKDRAIRMIQDKLDSYEMQRENDLNKAKQEAQNEPAQTSSIPAPPSPEPEQEEVDIRKTTDDEFIEKIVNSVAALEMAVDNRMQDSASAALAGLKQRFNNFNS